MTRALVCLACLLAVAGGCSGKRDARELLGPAGAGTIIVDARLIVGQRLPGVSVRTTQSPDRPYIALDAALSGVRVTISTQGPDSFVYIQESPGHYVPFEKYGEMSLVVLPNTTYHLRAVAPDGRVVRAQTTTPDSFRVREWVLLDEETLAERGRLSIPADYPYDPDSLFLAPSNQLIYQDGIVEARFDRGSALAFQMALFNLETNSPLLIDADFIDEEDLLSLERESSSPPLDAPDGFARLPWLAVWYEGRHLFRIYSVDRNWYDLARSLRFYGPSGLGFGSNAGDDFERPIFHVEGGIGLFGSAAMDETGFTVSPPP